MMRKKTIYLFTLFFLMLFPLTGCSFSSLEEKNSVKSNDHFTIGNSLIIDNIDNRFTLLDKKDTLASDGIYYVSWGIGNYEEYKNSDNDLIDLYDAQLYLLLGETKSEEDAKNKKESWLSAARENYNIIKEEEISCKEQPYFFVSYNCNKTDNPYAKGISAFGIFGTNSICIELTGRENFEEDLKTVLTDFLNHCSYNNILQASSKNIS